LHNQNARSVVEGYASYREHRTWYRVTGNLDSPLTPLVVIHGGLGLTHDYLNAYLSVGNSGRPIVQYDQIGNGRSTHFSAVTDDALSLPFYVGELESLLRHLGIANRYALLGHSCGACVAAEFATRANDGLKALVLANGFASLPLFAQSVRRRRSALPVPLAALLDEHESRGTLDSPECQPASSEFLQRFVCRVPFTPDLINSHVAMLNNPLVFQTMYGASLFQPTGRLRDWTIVDRLHSIKAPTLVLSGAFDEADETCSKPFVDRIPRVQSRVLAQSSHMPHIEQPSECIDAVRDYLDAIDAAR